MNAKITERDIQVILDVYKYRYLSASQIENLHFPSKRTAWRRLQTLTELGFLKAFTVPTIGERLYYLDKKGAEIIAIELHVDIEWHRHTREPKDYYFLKHFMAINDFQILLVKACQMSAITLLGFIPEYIGEKTKEGYVKKYLRDKIGEYSHTPDAAFALEKDGKPALFFLEIDRGIETVSDPEKGFLKCAVFYLHYWTDKAWHRYDTDFKREFSTFRMLVVTTSQDRLSHMREAVTRFSFPSEIAKRFLWGTIHSWLRVETVFDPIWQSFDVNDPTPYKIG
jgi:protein involved in plasmid replication-relaxation